MIISFHRNHQPKDIFVCVFFFSSFLVVPCIRIYFSVTKNWKNRNWYFIFFYFILTYTNITIKKNNNKEVSLMLLLSDGYLSEALYRWYQIELHFFFYFKLNTVMEKKIICLLLNTNKRCHSNYLKLYKLTDNNLLLFCLFVMADENSGRFRMENNVETNLD